MATEDRVEKTGQIFRKQTLWDTVTTRVCKKEKESGMAPMFWFGKSGALITERENREEQAGGVGVGLGEELSPWQVEVRIPVRHRNGGVLGDGVGQAGEPGWRCDVGIEPCAQTVEDTVSPSRNVCKGRKSGGVSGTSTRQRVNRTSKPQDKTVSRRVSASSLERSKKVKT